MLLLKALVVVVAFIASSLANRIIGGQNAKDGDYPYVASLRNSQDEHFCGGSIIAPRTIVTSTYCLMRNSVGISAVVGSTSLRQGTRYWPEKTMQYPWFSNQLLTGDIGLVILNTTIVYSSKVLPIALGYDPVGGDLDVTLTGWGAISSPETTPSENLKMINLKTISIAQCKNLHGSSIIFDTQICTLTKAGEGACFGDYGGPAASNGKLVGIVSWMLNPCAIGRPDVYTRVSTYTTWINENTV